MALYTDHSILLAEGKELFFQLRAIHYEHYIHLTAVLFCHGGAEDREVVQGIIEKSCFTVVDGLYGGYSTLLFQPSQRQHTNVNSEYRWSVEQTASFDMLPVIHHRRQFPVYLAEDIFFYDHYIDPCGADILLGAGIDKIKAVEVHHL